MSNGYVLDTNALIWGFPDVFGETSRLSTNTTRLVRELLSGERAELVSIPSIVFVELALKWFGDPERAALIRYEVYEPLRSSDRVEFRAIDREVVDCLCEIRGSLSHHDLNDKLVLASAMALQWPLISADGAIKSYVESNRVIPRVLS